MDVNLLAHIEYQLCINIERVSSISGGAISQAYLIKTAEERFFCKTSVRKNALQLLQTEKVGLKKISEAKTIATPRVVLCDTFDEGAFIVMEYIEPKKPSLKDMALLGHQLAALHEFSFAETFGAAKNNFIGSLPQSNKIHSNWNSFFVQERLLPQLKLAQDGRQLLRSEMPTESILLAVCNNLLSEVKPCLLHGDLWSGNYLISSAGIPYLIDPSVYFGHHEVDIAMTHLFGGFAPSFYDAYSEHFKKVDGEKERRDMYQLYYLLVHLNIFGASYKNSVKTIIKKYF